MHAPEPWLPPLVCNVWRQPWMSQPRQELRWEETRALLTSPRAPGSPDSTSPNVSSAVQGEALVCKRRPPQPAVCASCSGSAGPQSPLTPGPPRPQPLPPGRHGVEDRASPGVTAAASGTPLKSLTPGARVLATDVASGTRPFPICDRGLGRSASQMLVGKHRALSLTVITPPGVIT